jgi:hypothetical protein
VECNLVHPARRPPIVLLYLPRVIMRMDNLMEWWLAGETEVLGENLPQCHFVHHRTYMTWPVANPDRRGGKPAMARPTYPAYKHNSPLKLRSLGFVPLLLWCTGTNVSEVTAASIFKAEECSCMFVRHDGTQLPVYLVLHTRRPRSWYKPLRERHISHNSVFLLLLSEIQEGIAIPGTSIDLDALSYTFCEGNWISGS